MPNLRSRAMTVIAATLLVPAWAGLTIAGAGPAWTVEAGPTSRAICGPGSLPETGAQGRVSGADVASGRAAQGYRCNAEQLAHFGDTGGFKVFRYVDAAGRECAYYDTTLLFPASAPTARTNLTGVYVLDMSDPAHPVRTDDLLTPAMQTPHESLSFNARRGLLAAVTANPLFLPGLVDLYDLSGDCRHPALKSSFPTGILGHEANFSPDGNTFWTSSTYGRAMAAIDISNPAVPVPLWTNTDFIVHGLNVSDDGARLYFADMSGQFGGGRTNGLTIMDVSQIQRRAVNPQATVVSHLTWANVSLPQVPIPVKIGGRPYLVEIDEYSSSVFAYDPANPVGAARIVDIADETRPTVVSNIRLEVNEPAARRGAQANDPGAMNGLQGYAGHYCAVPQRDEPGIVACSFIMSGLRVFDVRDPYHPKEIAYFNAPVGSSFSPGSPSDYAMSAPTFVPGRGEIWYSDGNSGFYALRITNGVWPFASSSGLGAGGAAATAASGRARRHPLPATGGPPSLALAGLALLALALPVLELRSSAAARPLRR